MMPRTAVLLALLASLASAQFCPDFSECTACEPGWQQPAFTEVDEYIGLEECRITIKWNYPFAQEDERANPRFVFTCTYQDGTPCSGGDIDVCASCQEIIFQGVSPAKTPFLTYSDSCGNVDTSAIGANCYSTGQHTTTSPIVKDTTTPIVTDPQDTTTPKVTDPQDTTTPKGTDPQDTTTLKGTDPQDTTTPKGTDPQDTTTPKGTDPQDTTTPKGTDPQDTTTPKGTDPQDTTTPKVTDPQDTTTVANPCRRSFNFIGGHCLLVDPFLQASWDEARFFCRELGADLAVITDDDLFLDILDFVVDNELEGASYWIGGNDRISDGTFVWMNGDSMEYGSPYWAVYGLGNNNYIQEPSNQGILNYDCVQMDATRYLYYDDDDCDNIKAAICEHELDSTTGAAIL